MYMDHLPLARNRFPYFLYSTSMHSSILAINIVQET